MRHLSTLLASVALLAAPAHAQTFSSPPDVGTYQQRPVVYASGTTLNVLGDGSNAKGGVAPAFSTHPEPVENETALNPAWILPPTATYCASGTSSACEEKKWRTQVESARFGYDDPIRFWGQPGVSHCHEFFGNKGTNAYSTRASLRARPASNAAGGPYQSTGYWEECTLKVIGGKVYAIPATNNTVYYAEETKFGEPIIDYLQRLHLLLRFIGGFNVSDPDDLQVKAELATANAQAGTAGRYSYAGNGWAGHGCELVDGSNAVTKAGAGYNLTHSWGFTMADGTDPWEGRCVAGSKIYAENNAPACWDGWNVSSPDGYKHFRYPVFDAVVSKTVCPNGWYKVPVFQVKSFHQTQGWLDYKTWYGAADAMVAANAGHSIVPGNSGHFDWMNGQAKALLDRWQPYCLGIGGTPHLCDYSAIDENGRLLSDSPAPDGSRNPQINLSRSINSNDITQLHLVDTSRASMIDMKGM